MGHNLSYGKLANSILEYLGIEVIMIPKRKWWLETS
jgi:hypothetical protein